MGNVVMLFGKAKKLNETRQNVTESRPDLCETTRESYYWVLFSMFLRGTDSTGQSTLVST